MLALPDRDLFGNLQSKQRQEAAEHHHLEPRVHLSQLRVDLPLLHRLLHDALPDREDQPCPSRESKAHHRAPRRE